MTDDEVRDFVAEQMIMQCATAGPRGLPHLVPLWYVPDGIELTGWTYAKSQKAQNLGRDPEQIEGYGLRLFERYAGELTPEIREMVAGQAQKRIGLRFVPSRVVSWDHRKLGGSY